MARNHRSRMNSRMHSRIHPDRLSDASVDVLIFDEIGFKQTLDLTVPREVIFGKGRRLACEAGVFSAGMVAKVQPLCHQEAIRRNAQTGVVMKSSPTSAFIVPQPQLLLQVLIIALDAPAHVCSAHQIVQCAGSWQAREVILFRPCLARWPFDEQPLLRKEPGFSLIAPGTAHPQCRKASRQGFIATFAPTDALQGTLRQTLREGFDTDRLAGRPWHHGRAALATARLGWQWLHAGGGQNTTALVIPTI